MRLALGQPRPLRARTLFHQAVSGEKALADGGHEQAFERHHNLFLWHQYTYVLTIPI
jgi:hypothetical protein